MSGELDDTQFASLRLPWGFGNRRVGIDLDTKPSEPRCMDVEAVGRSRSRCRSVCSSMAEESLLAWEGSRRFIPARNIDWYGVGLDRMG